jgi:signal transduction histidine kinase
MELPANSSGVNVRSSGTSRWVLLCGFGGLLILMAFGGFDAIRALDQIREGGDLIHSEFLRRERALEDIRGDLYLSGTYVRDYLLEPEPASAEMHRKSLETTRVDTEGTLVDYARHLRSGEEGPFQALRGDLDSYWKVLDPVFKWSPAERKEKGYGFLRDELFPRRMTMLRIADQIREINQEDLRLGDRGVLELFSGFRRRFILTLTVILVLGILLAAAAMRSILALQRNAAGRFEEVSAARIELKKLSARLVDAQEDERKGIARELHDEVGQSLSALVLGIGNLASALRALGISTLDAEIESVRSLAENAVRVVRNMSLLLRPSMLDDLGLVPALQWQAREMQKRWGLTVRVAADNIGDDLGDEHKTCIYRIVQEALNNISRHSGADTAKVVARQENNRIVLSIEDNGTGFDVEHKKGLGLLGIEERVTQLGGDLQVVSEKGRGTLISVVLPLQPLHTISESLYE